MVLDVVQLLRPTVNAGALNAQRPGADPQLIGRRCVLLAAAAMVAGGAAPTSPPAPSPTHASPTTALPVPPNDTLAFRMMRHGSEIGRHTLTFAQDGGALTVHIVVDALVTFVSIPIARYKHRSVETWHGTTLVGLTAETDKNGDREWMNAQRADDGLVVLGSKTKRYLAPGAAIPTSYWNKRMLDGPMISLEDGVLLSPKIADLRTDNVRLASGSVIPATHYNLSGAFAVDLWYDDNRSWVGMALTVADGSEVRYERL
jgi:hypothetical protein